MQLIQSESMDLSELVAAVRQHVTGLDAQSALLALAAVGTGPSMAHMRDEAREQMQRYPLAHLFARRTYARSGQKVAVGLGSAPSDGDAEAISPDLWATMVRNHALRSQLVVDVQVVPALQVLSMEHHYSLVDLYRLCRRNPWIPAGHELAWARGLKHGLNGDFATAACVLVPQIEHLVRDHVKRAGAHTLITGEHGVESEKGLSALLGSDEATAIFGEDLIFDMKALLTEPGGPNLRNVVAHGLGEDAELHSTASVYAWWTALRFVCLPLAAALGDEGETAACAPDPAYPTDA